jgi:hypothetical protein
MRLLNNLKITINNSSIEKDATEIRVIHDFKTQLLFLNKKWIYFILITFIFSCAHHILLHEGNIFLFKERGSCIIRVTLKAENKFEIHGAIGLLNIRENGTWYQTKDTIFFNQTMPQKQKPAFTLITEHYDNKINGTKIRIIEGLDSSHLLGPLILINDDKDWKKFRPYMNNEDIFIRDTIVNMINITYIPFNEIFEVSGNIFVFYYNDPEYVDDVFYQIPKKF